MRDQRPAGRRATRALLRLLTGALLAAVAAPGVRANAPATAWPQFRGSSALHGTSAATLPSTLKLLWTYEAGDAIESSAAIVDGVVYVGSGSGDLHAVSLADGSVKWKYRASPDGIGESSPAVAAGLVFVGDLSGVFHAIDVSTGKAAWTFKTGGEIKSSPVVTADTVLIGSYDTHLYALHAKTGKLQWKVKTEGYVHGTPSVAAGIAFITGCDEILRAIRVSDGTQLYTVSSGAYTGASPAILAGRAYYGTYENEFLSVDLRSRKLAWTYRHPQRSFPFYSSAAVADGRVFVGGRDKMMRALDAATGKELWSAVTGARVDSSPAVASGRVYVGSSDGKLYVFDAATGNRVQQFEAGGPLTASPAIASGRLVIGSQDGKLFCLGA